MKAHALTIDTETVWNAFHARLFGFVRRRVASDHDAEDIVQSVFARIQRWAGTEPIEDVSGWVFQIARNAVADYHRARTTAVRATAELVGEPSAGSSPSGSPSSVVGSTVERDAGAELAECLRPFVERLPHPYSEALTLTDLGGVSQTAAARQLGLSVSGMKSRVQRGRAMLRKLVLDCCDVELDARRHVVDYVVKRPRCDRC